MNKIVGLAELDNFIKSDFLPLLQKNKNFLFIGNLGAGKTTFIKKVLEFSGVTSLITSPTFNYVNVYKNKNEIVFNHFDLYRVGSLDSFFSLGLEDFFYNLNSFNFVEWPEIILDYLKQSEFVDLTLVVLIDYCSDDLNKRLFRIKPLISFNLEN